MTSTTLDRAGVAPASLFTYRDVIWARYRAQSLLRYFDGATDVTPLILEQINDIPVGGGGTVLLPPGTGIVQSPIAVTDRAVRFECFGRQGTILTPGASFPAGQPVLNLNYIYCSVSNLTIDGSLGGVKRGTGIGFGPIATRAHVSHTQIKNMGADGASFAGATSINAKFHDVQISGCAGNGLNLSSSCPDNEFTDVTVDTCLVGARIFSGSQTFTSCHFWGNTNQGWLIRAGSVRLHNCESETNGSFGVDGFNQDDLQVIGGHFWGNGANALNLTQMRHSRVNGATLRNNHGVGLWLQDCDGVAAIGNTAYDTQATKTQTWGIDVNGSTDNCVIEGNISKAADHVTGGIHWTTTGKNNEVGRNIGLVAQTSRHIKRSSTTLVPNATANAFGTAVIVVPSIGINGGGAYALAFQRIAFQSGGTFGSETLTIRCTATFDDGTTATVTRTYTSTGTFTELGGGDFYSLAKDGARIQQLAFDCASTIGSSAATGSFFADILSL